MSSPSSPGHRAAPTPEPADDRPRCKYQAPQERYRCERPAWKGSSGSYCIAHDPDTAKPADEFEAALANELKSAHCDFTGWQFLRDREFRGDTFRWATFDFAVFHGDSKFVRATFAGTALFAHTRFLGRVDFWDSVFEDSCFFEFAKFEDAASFLRVRFVGSAYIIQSTFRRGVGILNCRFGDYADFCGTAFHSKAEFYRTVFDGELILDKTSFARRADEWFAYEVGYVNALRHSIWSRASDYFYRCRYAYLRTLPKWSGKRWLLWFWEMLSGHGQRPKRVLLAGGVSIVLFGVVLWLAQPCMYSLRPGATLGIWDYVYVSTTTFSSLGLTDPSVAHLGVVRWIFPLEALWGAILVALFVVTLTKRLTW